MNKIAAAALAFAQAIAPSLGGNDAASAAPAMSFEERAKAFQALATDKQALADYAASRANVINPLLNFQSTVRYIFRPERLLPGATPVWDVPFEDTETTITAPKIGAIPTIQLEGKQISINTGAFSGGVEYQKDILRDGRFQVAELADLLLKSRFLRQEEMAGWNLIKAHAAILPASQQLQALKDDGTNGGAGTGKFNVPTINALLTLADQIGIGGRKVTDIYMSAKRFGDLRTAISVGLLLPDEVKLGIWNGGQGPDTVANIRFHRVYNRDLVPDNTAYAFTQYEGWTYGVMPIREELYTWNNPISEALEDKVGIMGRMRAGFGVLDAKGLVTVTF